MGREVHKDRLLASATEQTVLSVAGMRNPGEGLEITTKYRVGLKWVKSRLTVVSMEIM